MNGWDLYSAFGYLDEDLIDASESAALRLVGVRKEKSKRVRKGLSFGLAAACCVLIAAGTLRPMFRAGSAAPATESEAPEAPMEMNYAADCAPAEGAKEKESESAVITADSGNEALLNGVSASAPLAEEKAVKERAAEDGMLPCGGAIATLDGKDYVQCAPQEYALGERTDKTWNEMTVFCVEGYTIEEMFAVIADDGESCFFVRCEE